MLRTSLMRASSHKLAAALADRIGEILPPPLTSHARGSSVLVYANEIGVGSTMAPLILEENDDRTIAERAECVARAVLSTIQDEIAEYLTLEWPVDAWGKMAMPSARTASERLYLWYGESEAEAVITLRPINFEEFII